MFNWVGNKLKYKDLIFEKINNKDIIVDPMMGSGNILLELLKKNKTVIGNDIIPLMPTLFKNAQNYNYSEKDISLSVKLSEEGIIDKVYITITPDGYKLIKIKQFK